MPASFLDQPLGRFLDLVAAREAAPGAGAVAAVTVAAAAGLVAMAARFSDKALSDSADLAARADLLRGRACALAVQDAEAYAAVLAAAAVPREPDPQARAAGIRQALRVAAEVPLGLTDLAAQVAGLALRLVEDGNPNLTADAATAILLAEAAGRAAAGLVRVNAAQGKLGRDLTERAEAFVRAAALARERSRAGGAL